MVAGFVDQADKHGGCPMCTGRQLEVFKSEDFRASGINP